MPVDRLNYFHYQFLQENDFTDEQSYHLSMRRRHNQNFHTPGRVQGLDVSFTPGEKSVTVSPGMAVDNLGREIVVDASFSYDLSTIPVTDSAVYLVVKYQESLTHLATQAGLSGTLYTRTTESFQLGTHKLTETWDRGLEIILAKITLNLDRTVNAKDFSDRTEAGAKIGDATLPGLQFTVLGHRTSDLPQMRGKNVGPDGSGVQGIDVTASVTAFSGSVSVQGDLNVTGVVNKADELVIKDNIVRVNNYSPPSATPVVINGGLEVYRGGTAPNAQLIWDETTDRWKAGIQTSLDFVSKSSELDAKFDPATGHRHTGAAGDGPKVSHGDLNSVLGAVQTSTDLAQDKHVSNAQTKGWQDHVNVTSGNPHNTTAAMLGALPLATYAFSTSTHAAIVFSEANADGAQATISTNFVPKFVWVSGTMTAKLGDNTFGTPVSGFADLRNSAAFLQQGNGADITRLVVAPYLVFSGLRNAGVVCTAKFTDWTGPNVKIEILSVAISAVTPTSLIMRLSRIPASTSRGTVYPEVTAFSISLDLLCFG